MQIEDVPVFAPGVRFRFDKARGCWALLAPERLFQPDEQAVAILTLIAGVEAEILDKPGAPPLTARHDPLDELLPVTRGRGAPRHAGEFRR